MNWDSDLSVGIDLIDEQHKMLIDKLNDLSAAVDNKRGVPKIIKTLDFLIEYTDFHFGTEKKNMEEYCYDAIDFHLQQHEKFKNTLKDLEMDFEEEGVTESLASAIDTFMINWLINHIKVVDVEFGAFLRENDFECKL
jgi:hemerythrin